MAESFDKKRINKTAFSYYPRLGRVNAYCRSHLADALPLDEVAAHASLETSYFSRYFHEKVGVTFSEWLQHLRVSEAKHLLISDDCSISEIGQQVGYKNLRTFERNFRKHIGNSPGKFRSERRN